MLDRTNERRVAQGLAVVKSMEDIKDTTEAPDPFLDETAYITLDMIDAKKLAKTNVQ